MKLNGHNPATIISQEIRESTHAGKDYESALHNIIRGDPNFSIQHCVMILSFTCCVIAIWAVLRRCILLQVDIRARVKDKCTSATEQVECLVDMATDPNILGRTWGGWAPWI